MGARVDDGKEASEGSGMSQETRILVVDDDEVLLDLMTRRLDKMGLAADRAENGNVGLEMIEANRYGLVISDIYMPGATGIDVLKAAKAKDATCQVITITGGATIEMALKALDEGAFIYLTKPFDHLRVFDHAVKRALEFRRLLQAGEGEAAAGPAVESKPVEESPAHQVLDRLPFPVLWLGEGGSVLVQNSQAQVWLEKGLSTRALMEKCQALLRKSEAERAMMSIHIGGAHYRMLASQVLEARAQETVLVTIIPGEARPGDEILGLDEPLDLLKRGLSWLYQQRLHEREFRVIRGLARQVQALEMLRQAHPGAAPRGNGKGVRVNLPVPAHRTGAGR